MRRSTPFILLFAFILPACGARSPDDSCAVICEKSALCQEGSTEALCTSTCLDLAADDPEYADSLSNQADCYEEQADYYEDPKGICIALEGGACQAAP